MRKLLKAILFGTAIGALLPAFFAFMSLLSHVVAYGPLHEETLGLLLFLIRLVAFVFIIVALSSLFIGLPTTWMLQRLGAESNMAYSIIGGAVGFLLPLLILPMLMPFAFMAGCIGCLSGLATAHTWWRWSRAKANSVDSGSSE